LRVLGRVKHYNLEAWKLLHQQNIVDVTCSVVARVIGGSLFEVEAVRPGKTHGRRSGGYATGRSVLPLIGTDRLCLVIQALALLQNAPAFEQSTA